MNYFCQHGGVHRRTLMTVIRTLSTLNYNSRQVLKSCPSKLRPKAPRFNGEKHSKLCLCFFGYIIKHSSDYKLKMTYVMEYNA
jgi:hypothetical protein